MHTVYTVRSRRQTSRDCWSRRTKGIIGTPGVLPSPKTSRRALGTEPLSAGHDFKVVCALDKQRSSGSIRTDDLISSLRTEEQDQGVARCVSRSRSISFIIQQISYPLTSICPMIHTSSLASPSLLLYIRLLPSSSLIILCIPPDTLVCTSPPLLVQTILSSFCLSLTA